MIARHRKYRLALGLAVAAQTIAFGSVLYLNCGWFDEPLSVPPCAPWLPPGARSLLPGFFHAIPWLVRPGAWLLPSGNWPRDLPLPLRLQEWIPAATIVIINVALWTPALGTLFFALARLRKRASGLRPATITSVEFER